MSKMEFLDGVAANLRENAEIQAASLAGLGAL
jgi:hypothetical protein